MGSTCLYFMIHANLPNDEAFRIPEVGIYKRKIWREKERKHDFDPETSKIKKKKENTLSKEKNERKQELDQEKK